MHDRRRVVLHIKNSDTLNQIEEMPSERIGLNETRSITDNVHKLDFWKYKIFTHFIHIDGYF